jgi:demethylmenaquinone methyltransferase/2-methoxy-6-polyprenyl-1,4-benzoquinol methylase
MVRVEEPPVAQESQAPPQVVSTWSGSAREQAVQRMFTSIAAVYDLNNTL